MYIKHVRGVCVVFSYKDSNSGVIFLRKVQSIEQRRLLDHILADEMMFLD